MNNLISKPRRVWGKRRFEREHSNSLWQADYKLAEQDEWMVSYLDDHSRFVPGSRVHHNPTTEHAIKLLEESMRQYGKPDQILTDRGSQFYPKEMLECEFRSAARLHPTFVASTVGLTDLNVNTKPKTVTKTE